jgi:hypothetical protein
MHWATLNEMGKALYGEIFPDGRVPVVSMIPSWAKLGGSKEASKVYIVKVSGLSEQQFSKIVEMVSARFGADREVVEKDFKDHGIPLREELTSGAGTDELGSLLSMADVEDSEYDEDEDRDEEGYLPP